MFFVAANAEDIVLADRVGVMTRCGSPATSTSRRRDGEFYSRLPDPEVFIAIFDRAKTSGFGWPWEQVMVVL